MSDADVHSLLRQSFLFGGLEPAVLARLADAASLYEVSAGFTLFHEGAQAQYIYIIVSGRAEEAAEDDGSLVPVALAARGDVLGEEALRESTTTYCSTVRALEPLTLVALPLQDLAALSEDPEFGRAAAWDGDALDRIRLVKRATAFEGLNAAAACRLAASLVERNLGRGETLVRKGDVPAACWIVESGPLEARVNGATVASLKAGDLIGEVSLAAGEPARADVVAVGTCRLLELSRAELVSALRESRQLRASLTPRARIRLRPFRAEGIETHLVPSSDGSEVTVLKDPARLRYFRLSALGAFVWSQLDGTRSIKDLVIGYMRHAKLFAIEPIAIVLEGLISSGFARTRADLTALSSEQERPRGMLSRMAMGLKHLLTWHISVGRGDSAAEALRRIFSPLATAPGLIVASCLALLGFLLTMRTLVDDNGPLQGALVHPLLLLVMIFSSIVIHEAAHAVATKAAGRSINGIGIGWHWITPVAFVDTTDSWLATPRQRVGITLAGPLANGALAGIASVAAICLSSMGGDGDWLWVFALVNVYLMLFNLAPIMFLDGYLALTDMLGKPLLREEALAELRTFFKSSWPSWREPPISPLHFFYLLGSLLYLAGLAWLTLTIGRVIMAPYLAAIH